MRRTLTLLALAFVLAAGCTPSPEQTCEKLQKLADDDKGKFKLSMSKCLDNMKEMKERDAQAYKCAAKIVKSSSSLDMAFLGISVCDPDGKKKGKKGKGKDED